MNFLDTLMTCAIAFILGYVVVGMIIDVIKDLFE